LDFNLGSQVENVNSGDTEGVGIYTQEQIMYHAVLMMFNNIVNLDKKIDTLLENIDGCDDKL
jgi:hypothetical protein